MDGRLDTKSPNPFGSLCGQKQIWPLQLHSRRNATRQPVMHALRPALPFVAQHFGDLCCPAKAFNEFAIIHASSLNHVFSFGKHCVSPSLHSPFMGNTVWQRLDDELDARRNRHLKPSSWADVARFLETSEQRVNNWKRRGIPAAQHATLAALFGWSVDQLLGLADGPSSPPPRPPRDFGDRQQVSNTDWAKLEELHDIELVPPLRRRLDELRAELAELKSVSIHLSKRVEESQAAAKPRGISVFGELNEVPAPVEHTRFDGRKK